MPKMKISRLWNETVIRHAHWSRHFDKGTHEFQVETNCFIIFVNFMKLNVKIIFLNHFFVSVFRCARHYFRSVFSSRIIMVHYGFEKRCVGFNILNMLILFMFDHE